MKNAVSAESASIFRTTRTETHTPVADTQQRENTVLIKSEMTTLIKQNCPVSRKHGTFIGSSLVLMLLGMFRILRQTLNTTR